MADQPSPRHRFQLHQPPPNDPAFDGESVPRTVEYLARLVIRWTLYAVAALLIVAAIIAQCNGAGPIVVGLCAVAGAAVAVLGWTCNPRRT